MLASSRVCKIAAAAAATASPANHLPMTRLLPLKLIIEINLCGQKVGQQLMGGPPSKGTAYRGALIVVGLPD